MPASGMIIAAALVAPIVWLLGRAALYSLAKHRRRVRS